jgi:hypothetical protein
MRNGDGFRPRKEYPVAAAIGRALGTILTTAITVMVATLLAALVVKSFVFSCRLVDCLPE